MRHISVKLNTPCEFINVTEINPLVSHVEIKVCYVDDEPNRNQSIITKEVAKQLAQSLPGSPIVGLYNDTKEDFEEHNKIIEIAGNKITLKDKTRPYGFVDVNAKVWFQKYLDDNEVEREYLCTEGYIWTGQYPESQRIVEKGNNQSMELDAESLDATWAKDINGKPKFFIINEAIISKLCILGEDVEPCFEGASITEFSLSFDEEFKNTLFSKINEIKEYLQEGGNQKMTEFAVEIGCGLWDAIYSYLVKNYPDPDCDYCSMYRIVGIYEENSQKFAILGTREGKYFRLDLNIVNDEVTFNESLTEVEMTFVPVENPQFSAEAYEAYVEQYKKKAEEEDKAKKEEPEEGSDESKKEDDQKKEDPEEKDPEPKEDDEEDEDKKKNYSLDEIPEYAALQGEFEELKNQYSALEETNNNLQAQVDELLQFKAAVDRKEKEAMIAQFYMLSDAEKKDVVDHIDEYSLDDIESKLSVICVRNKVSFSLDDDNKQEPSQDTTFNLNGNDLEDSTPEWIKAIQRRSAEKE